MPPKDEQAIKVVDRPEAPLPDLKVAESKDQPELRVVGNLELPEIEVEETFTERVAEGIRGLESSGLNLPVLGEALSPAGFVKDAILPALDLILRTTRAGAQLASTPVGYGIDQVQGGDITFNELAQENFELAKDMISHDTKWGENVEKAGRLYLESQGVETLDDVTIKDIGVLASLGFFNILGDPFLEATAFARLAQGIKEAALFKKVGEIRRAFPEGVKLLDPRTIEIPIAVEGGKDVLKIKIKPLDSEIVIEGFARRGFKVETRPLNQGLPPVGGFDEAIADLQAIVRNETGLVTDAVQIGDDLVLKPSLTTRAIASQAGFAKVPGSNLNLPKIAEPKQVSKELKPVATQARTIETPEEFATQIQRQVQNKELPTRTREALTQNDIVTKDDLIEFFNEVNRPVSTAPVPPERALVEVRGEDFTFEGIPQTRGQSAATRIRRETSKAIRERSKKIERQKAKATKKEIITKAKERFDKKVEGVRDDKEVLARRRQFIQAVQRQFQLSDADLKSITRKDIRLMTNFEFKKFLDDIRVKSEQIAETRQIRNELLTQVQEKELNIEPLRQAMSLPKVSEMSALELNQMIEAIEPIAQGDVFLSKRKLETIDRTELEGIKTYGEARKVLAKKLGIVERPAVPPGLESLAEEARKFKTAEEFVKAQPKVFHGTDKGFKTFNISKSKEGLFGKGLYFTDDQTAARRFGSNIQEATVSPESRLLDFSENKMYSVEEAVGLLEKLEVPIKDAHRTLQLSLIEGSRLFNYIVDVSETGTFPSKVLNSGFDGVVARNLKGAKAPNQTVIFNPNVVKTKSQLIDIWKQANQPQEEVAIGSIKISEFDRFRGDTALAEREPFFRMMVEETAKLTMIREAEFLEIEKKALRLAKKLKTTLTEKVIPQQKNIVKWFEAEDKSTVDLTQEEADLVEFMQGEWIKARDYLIRQEAIKKGINSDNYFTHVRRGILEAVKEDGVVAAVKEVFDQYKLDEQSFNILDGQTGEVLALDKFFQFALRRTGELKPTENVTKAFLIYMRTFKKKQALDEIVPLIDIYAHALTPVGKTDTGLLLHGNLIRFTKEWLNTQKGRRINIVAKQGGKIDWALRGLKTFTSLLDIGLNLPVSVATQVGEQAITYQLLGKKKFVLAKKRGLTKQGRKITEKFRNFIGKSPWKELAEPAKEIGDRLSEGIFILFRDANVRRNKEFLLGSLTSEEFKTGKITPERLAHLRTELGRYGMLGDAKSIIGATPEAGQFTQYKSWALPIMRTTYSNVASLTKLFGKDKVKGKRAVLELYRIAELLGLVFLVKAAIGEDEDDDSLIGQMKRRAYQEASTLVQAMSPELLFSVPRNLNFLSDLGKNISTLIKLEEYQQTRFGQFEAGDLKGVRALQRQLTPRAVKQFEGDKEKTLDDVKDEISKAIENEELSIEAAKIKFIEEAKKLERKEKDKRFGLPLEEYKGDLATRIQAGEITVEEAKEEFIEYSEKKPESFESDDEVGFIDKVRVYAQAVGTDPITAFNRIFTGQKIRRVDSGAIIVERLKLEESQKIKQKRGATKDLILDHFIPLQLGGSNSEANLKLVPVDEWERYTIVENYLGDKLRAEEIDKGEAQELITDFKNGEIKAEDIIK